MRSPLPQSPALSSGVASTTSGGDSADEVTLESLGVKVGERVIIDAASSKPKVKRVRDNYTCRQLVTLQQSTMTICGYWSPAVKGSTCICVCAPLTETSYLKILK